MSENTDSRVEDLELAHAEKVLAAARDRRAQAQQDIALAARAALAKSLADEEDRLLQIRIQTANQQDAIKAKLKAKEESIREAERLRVAHRQMLEREAAAEEEKLHAEQERQNRVKRVLDAARQEEIDARNLENALAQARCNPEPIDITPTLHPLDLVFGTGHAAPIVEISASDNMRLQAALDRERDALMVKTGNLNVDGNDLAMVSKAVYDSTGERANNESLIALLTQRPASDVLAALKIVAAEHKVRRMSITSIVHRISQVMDLSMGQQAPVKIYAQAPTSKELPKQTCGICGELVDYSLAFHCNPKNILNIRSARSAGIISAKEAEALMEARGTR
jgi:hypothetical protein